MRDEFASAHGDIRLWSRSGYTDETMTELWEEGVPCEIKYAHYDEARAIPRLNCALLMRDNKVVTVYDDMHHVTIKGEDFEQYLDGAIDD